jgi:hypothetical protein
MDEKREIFICYAHEDEQLRQSLEKHLRVLQQQDLITVWHDRKIRPGADWEQEIDTALNHAHIVLLLVSPDFMASDYCYGTEMKRALQRHEQGLTRVLPIILRPVHWQTPPLRKLQALPTDARPVVSSSWHSQDDAFYDVAEGIRNAIKELATHTQFTPSKKQPSPQKSIGQLGGDQPIVSSLIKDAATSQGFTTQHGGWWGDRVKRLIAIAIILALVVSIAALVGNQVFNPLRDPKVTSTPTLAPSGATITFDALGGSSNVIEVYPGVGNTLQDKTHNGTYNSGDTVSIVCKTKGRTVTSNPADNEQYRQDDVWYKLQTPPGTQPEYATAVYADEHGPVPQC